MIEENIESVPELTGDRAVGASGASQDVAAQAMVAGAPPALLPIPPLLPIIAIGASAGGLEAASRLFDAISLAVRDNLPDADATAGGPGSTGMAFILVQHLDPTHRSLLTELLADHTAMTVIEASEGCPLVADHVYIIPPGRYISVRAGALHLSLPQDPRGSRMAFDYLLHSLAEGYGPQTVAVILSGTGNDGSTALTALKAAGGFVIAQNPDEAEYNGMPRRAVDTGLVDQILTLAQMPQALADRVRVMKGQAQPMPPHPASAAPAGAKQAGAEEDQPEGMADILSLLKESTAQDFSQYKPGTIGRRIERRMGLLSLRPGDLAGYLALLQQKPAERDLLAQDLLINVTSFFRDPKVFETLGKVIIPEMLERIGSGQVLRIWVAGCSTGEEAYSIAMVCRDAIEAAGLAIKLQIFASDVDIDAITFAREGHYTADIADMVPADRLARYFIREEGGYRVTQLLRGFVVFTVQDVLVDPPFSRIDLVSCRNLLIYFNHEAQAKAISLFHFALREGGVLVLGSAETVGKAEGRFEAIAKNERIYRHVARSRPGEPGFPFSFGDTLPRMAQPSRETAPAAPVSFADICGRAVLATHAPAAVLINRSRHVVFSMGPTERYLRVAAGYASLDLLAMAAPVLRTKLRLAIDKAEKTQSRVRTSRSRLAVDGGTIWFGIDVEPLGGGDEDLLLVCFVEEQALEASPGKRAEAARIAELEHELESAQAELQVSIQAQESSNQEQKAINEEALSVNEEFQSTNEELLTSKEELQSLNEELTALNGQLQETLDRQLLASDDLQNVLYSTNVGTLFLDKDLRIRFFTPAVKALFNVIPGDIGRPLADLAGATTDGELLADARKVLAGAPTIEREVPTPNDTWFQRRIFPYLTHNGKVEGVVITFADITEHRLFEAAMDASKQGAERANLAKSRFLAAASHDLRQPLQSLTLLQELLVQCVEGEKPKKLLLRFEQTLRAMSGMLNALLDINQIEAGAVQPKPVIFAIADVFDRLRNEIGYMAQTRGLDFRMLPTTAMVESDPRLIEQMLRNLLGNAIKYTPKGRVLLGCHRRGDQLRIEVYDTGIGIAADELKAIFEEFHQVDNAARESSRGLGLGLSIVQRLGHLLGADVDVRSMLGKGSVFAITLPLRSAPGVSPAKLLPLNEEEKTTHGHGRKIMVVDDDPDVLDLLELLLKSDGYTVQPAPDATAAIQMLAGSTIRPEILLTDYNLPNGLNGLDLVSQLRAMTDPALPAIILTGDISTETMTRIAAQNCIQLSKPVDPRALMLAIERLRLREAPPVLPLVAPPVALSDTGPVSGPVSGPVVRLVDGVAPTTYIVDDDPEIRILIRELLEGHGLAARDFESAEAFLDSYRPGGVGCLLVDAHMPGMSGVGLLGALRARGDHIPVILITGDGDVGLAVDAMRTGACDFIEKPVGGDELLASIGRAIDLSHGIRMVDAVQEQAAAHIAELTDRQREVMAMVLAGHPSKNIAADLDISQRTVENHRAAIMHRMGVKSIPELARLVLRAEGRRGPGDGAAS